MKMTYLTPRDRFIQESNAYGFDPEDTMFLADLEFDENGDPKPGSIYAVYRTPEA